MSVSTLVTMLYVTHSESSGLPGDQCSPCVETAGNTMNR